LAALRRDRERLIHQGGADAEPAARGVDREPA
jgi:hypothetical protein